MSFSQTPPQQRQEQIGFINNRWRQLYELEKESGQTALQFLFLTNAGGAVATLAFIGAIGAGKIGIGAKLALAFFVVGVILLGVSRAKQFHHMSGLFKHWKSLVAAYFSDKTTYDYILGEDNKKAVDDICDYVFPYASFGCFIIGSIVGFISLI
jgi:hypothetical protein